MLNKEPIWLSLRIVTFMHFKQIQEHGGIHGIRDQTLLESAMCLPRHQFLHNHDACLWSLTAAYGYGLVKNHCFFDGNKRVAFISMYVFLNLNGFDLEAEENEVVSIIQAFADGSLTEKELSLWIKSTLR